MSGEVLLWIGSMIPLLWGIAHLVPTRSVVAGFGTLSQDNRRIITMEWIAEGLALCFIGLLGILLAIVGAANPVAIAVYRALAAMLVVMAGLSAMTGARTSILPMKVCPFVKVIAATLIFAGTLV